MRGRTQWAGVEGVELDEDEIMLSERVSFVVTHKADQSIQLGIAEPSGIGVCNSPLFNNSLSLKEALKDVGLPAHIASQNGFCKPRRVSFLQLVHLGFF